MQAMTYPRVVACSATPGLLSGGAPVDRRPR